LQGGEDNGNNGNADEDEPSDHMDRLGLGDLGIRRVSDISHINEIRREVTNFAVYISIPIKKIKLDVFSFSP
jgi:hypothetical protein